MSSSRFSDVRSGRGCRLAAVVGGAARVAAMLAIPALAESPPPREKAVRQVAFSQIQLARFYSGSVGGGVLSFKGRDYAFSMRGVGYGGIGASRVEAVGEVYGLTRASDFYGPYVQAGYGVSAGKDDIGGFWLRNAKGVELRHEIKREGLALSLDGDAVYVRSD